jgi:uncharacterized protein YneF (UPF0154 family)
MEGLVTRILLLTLLITANALASEKVVGRLYFKHMMGHIHKNPSINSSSLTTIQCAHGVKVIEDEEISVPKGWMYVLVGDDRGFVQADFLQQQRPVCFQGKFPKFFNSLNLDLTDMYYWGRLYDHFDMQESKVR